jgi:hypothetical protein
MVARPSMLCPLRRRLSNTGSGPAAGPSRLTYLIERARSRVDPAIVVNSVARLLEIHCPLFGIAARSLVGAQ